MKRGYVPCYQETTSIPPSSTADFPYVSLSEKNHVAKPSSRYLAFPYLQEARAKGVENSCQICQPRMSANDSRTVSPSGSREDYQRRLGED